MATSSFTREIVITGKKAVDLIIDVLISDTPRKNNTHEIQEFIAENRKRGRASLEKFASHYNK